MMNINQLLKKNVFLLGGDIGGIEVFVLIPK
jgi:hypothetical protein